MRPSLVFALGLSVCACSSEPQRQAAPDRRAIAQARLAQLSPRLGETIQRIHDFGLEIAPKLVDQLGSNAVAQADSAAATQQATYLANMESYSATPSGIEAGMRAQNKIKDTKISGLRRALALKKVGLPLVASLDNWAKERAVAEAGRHEIPTSLRIRAAKGWLAESENALKKIEKLEPASKVETSSLLAQLAAFKVRLNEDVNEYNSIAGALGLPPVS